MSALRTTLVLVSFTLLWITAQFQACQRNQPADILNECVRESLQKAVPELVKGLPEYGLTTIDPLRIESVVIPKGQGKISVDLTFKNLDIIGLRSAKIISAEMDVNNFKMSSKLEFTEPIMLQGEYIVKGQVLVLPIEGSGRCNITLTNMKADITELQGESVIRDNTEYAKVTSFKFDILGADRVYYDLQNLFKGNKELGENMNLVLNDNWKQVFEDMRVPIQTAMEVAFTSILHEVIANVPYIKMFP